MLCEHVWIYGHHLVTAMLMTLAGLALTIGCCEQGFGFGLVWNCTAQAIFRFSCIKSSVLKSSKYCNNSLWASVFTSSSSWGRLKRYFWPAEMWLRHIYGTWSAAKTGAAAIEVANAVIIGVGCMRGYPLKAHFTIKITKVWSHRKVWHLVRIELTEKSYKQKSTVQLLCFPWFCGWK